MTCWSYPLPSIRPFIKTELHDWGGDRMPLSRIWADDAVADFHDGTREVARLALMVSKSPSQVGDDAVSAVLDGRGLLKLLTWTGMTATRHLRERAAERAAQGED